VRSGEHPSRTGAYVAYSYVSFHVCTVVVYKGLVTVQSGVINIRAISRYEPPRCNYAELPLLTNLRNSFTVRLDGKFMSEITKSSLNLPPHLNNVATITREIVDTFWTHSGHRPPFFVPSNSSRSSSSSIESMHMHRLEPSALVSRKQLRVLAHPSHQVSNLRVLEF